MKKYIYRFEAMSTHCELIIYANDKKISEVAAHAVLLETKRLEKKYNYYTPDSNLSQINNRTLKELDNETKNLLQRAKQYYKLTNGIFDITIATIKELYRVEKDEDELLRKKESLKEFIGCEHFSIKKNKIRFDNPHTKIDLGGFVKEYAVDRAVEVLQKNKISSALVNFGADVYALGKKPDNSQYSIGIKDPSNPTSFATQVFLEDEALTTSASYERNYKVGATKYSHIISKEQLQKNVNSVSVISKNCVESGVYSTSLMIDETIENKNRVIFL